MTETEIEIEIETETETETATATGGPRGPCSCGAWCGRAVRGVVAWRVVWSRGLPRPLLTPGVRACVGGPCRFERAGAARGRDGREVRRSPPRQLNEPYEASGYRDRDGARPDERGPAYPPPPLAPGLRRPPPPHHHPAHRVGPPFPAGPFPGPFPGAFPGPVRGPGPGYPAGPPRPQQPPPSPSLPDPLTLTVSDVPKELLTTKALAAHFGRFGAVSNIRLKPDAKQATISFATHAMAQAAVDSPEAVCGNRFIKIGWVLQPGQAAPASGPPRPVSAAMPHRGWKAQAAAAHAQPGPPGHGHLPPSAPAQGQPRQGAPSRPAPSTSLASPASERDKLTKQLWDNLRKKKDALLAELGSDSLTAEAKDAKKKEVLAVSAEMESVYSVLKKNKVARGGEEVLGVVSPGSCSVGPALGGELARMQRDMW